MTKVGICEGLLRIFKKLVKVQDYMIHTYGEHMFGSVSYLSYYTRPHW